jgi:phytoene synthase
MAVDHYENFPVASILLPARLRRPVTDIYRFARSADDIADEGDEPDAQRLAALSGYRQALEAIRDGAPGVAAPEDAQQAIFGPLAETVHAFSLHMTPFFDLLSAFEQDVRVHRYPDEDTLLDYCRRSADPVGRLMLHLHGAATPRNQAYADAICTGLQLTNFWQDVALDWHKGRLYIPRDALARHGVHEDFIRDQSLSSGSGGRTGSAAPRRPSWGGEQGRAWRTLMRNQVEKTRARLISGLPLAGALPARAGFELKLVVLGGLRVLERLDQLHYDMFRHRPTLRGRDWTLMLLRACRPLRRRTHRHPDTENP